MPKSNKTIIEADEKKIIEQLIKDARQSPNEIAEKLDVSRQKIWRTIKKLEKENDIWGYTAVINEKKFRKNTYFALGKIKSPLSNVTEDIISRLREQEYVKKIEVDIICVYYLNGIYDWIVVFYAKDISDAKKFCGFIQVNYPNYVEKVDLLENIFPLIKFGKINPDIDKLTEFSVS